MHGRIKESIEGDNGDMKGIENIFNKLNIAEQMQLNTYLNREITAAILKQDADIEQRIGKAEKELMEEQKRIRQYYVDMNDETWGRVETSLHVAMREARISEERINKIDKRVLELNKQAPEKELLLGEEVKSDYKILIDADFQKIIELSAHAYCKDCSMSCGKCELYPMLKKYNIPEVNEGFKCKYAYSKEEK